MKIMHTINFEEGEIKFETLEDILPENGTLDILIVGKTPSPFSVMKGDYFQGSHGMRFWHLMTEKYGIMKADPLAKEKGNYDDYLLDNKIGITDIVKRPHLPGKEPRISEYREGWVELQKKIKKSKPKLIIFFYKKGLRKILKIAGIKHKIEYGFNQNLHLFDDTEVFVYPAAGTGKVTTSIIEITMTELKNRYSLEKRRQ
jgi:mismatch-specific thymine-DNA glycosylase